jgi:hypothetical protein
MRSALLPSLSFLECRMLREPRGRVFEKRQLARGEGRTEREAYQLKLPWTGFLLLLLLLLY